MNANIRALQFAELELRDHDRREAELRAELKEHRKARVDKAARVQECIDVLCGRATPDLFVAVSEPPACVPTAPATEFAPLGDPSEWEGLAPPAARQPRPGTVGRLDPPPAADPPGVRYPADDGWRKQGLALLKLNEKLLKACKRQEVATLGELHDWIDEETRDAGGFFGPGVLARELSRIGKLAAKWGQANAEIIYQFCADYGFAGVPEKEVA